MEGLLWVRWFLYIISIGTHNALHHRYSGITTQFGPPSKKIHELHNIPEVQLLQDPTTRYSTIAVYKGGTGQLEF